MKTYLVKANKFQEPNRIIIRGMAYLMLMGELEWAEYGSDGQEWWELRLQTRIN